MRPLRSPAWRRRWDSPAFIFVPERAPEPKIAQLLMFGATVFRVRGTYEQAFELCRAACERFRWYNRNSGTNPYLVEGKKTAGLEIAEQFSGGAMLDGALPDWVAVSVGDGCTIGGITKGLHEFKRLGLAGVMPRMLGVQADGASPIVRAFESKADVVPSGARHRGRQHRGRHAAKLAARPRVGARVAGRHDRGARRRHTRRDAGDGAPGRGVRRAGRRGRRRRPARGGCRGPRARRRPRRSR